MIAEELRAEIRRKFFAEKWKVGTIASTLGVHHTTVELAIEESPKVRVRRQQQSVLEPYKGFIADTLQSYPKLIGTRVLAMIVARGYTGGIAVLRRHLRTVRPSKQPEAFFRRTVLAGASNTRRRTPRASLTAALPNVSRHRSNHSSKENAFRTPRSMRRGDFKFELSSLIVVLVVYILVALEQRVGGNLAH